MDLTALITDYLNTQGLRLDVAAVRDAAQILGTIAGHTTANIAHEALWSAAIRSTDVHGSGEVFDLKAYLSENPHNDQLLRGMYAAADTLFTQYPCTHLSVFLLKNKYLLRLFSCGSIGEGILAAGEEDWRSHLAARCACSAWLIHAENCAEWLNAGDLIGHHQHPMRQWALPVCWESGALQGVLYGESEQYQPFDEVMQAWWVAFAIVLANPMGQLS